VPGTDGTRRRVAGSVGGEEREVEVQAASAVIATAIADNSTITPSRSRVATRSD
jgi:hypothetical protein